MSVGIVGLGTVGTAVFEGIELYHDVHGYDIDGRGDWNQIMTSDALFICVPTEGTREGVLDSGIIEEVVSRISSSDYEGLIIVKSTLQPGTMARLESLFPTVRIVYMPEFLREKDAKEWFQNPDRLVAAGSSEDVNEAWTYFEWVPASIPRLTMTCLEAEIGKLAHNSYIATKVAFTCEVERLCRTFDADPRPVMEIVSSDRRVQNPAHLTPGLGGFDGKCVPKDTRALRSLDVDTPLLDTVCETGSDAVVRRKMANISSKSINPAKSDGIRNKIVSLVYKLFKGTLYSIVVLSMMFFSYGLIDMIVYSEEIDNPNIHIIGTEREWVDMRVGDYITILNINSTILDSESSSYTTCMSTSDGGSDCSTTITQHLTMVVNSANNSYELSSADFLEECFGRECAATGMVYEIREDVVWLIVEGYYVV